MRDNNRFSGKLIVLTLLFASVILLVGCGGGGGGTPSGGGGSTPVSGTIGGTAVKGPVSGATVTAFAINNGVMGSQIGSGRTDGQGSFSMGVGDYAGAVMLQMRGETYTDEATGTNMSMQQSDVMTAVIPFMTTGSTMSGIQMTPLTSMAQTMAQNMSGGMTQANITQANGSMGQYFGVNDILHTHPMDPLANGSGAAATPDERNYGMTIAAMSQYAHMVGMSNSSGMVTAMMNDASDGRMNGMMGGTQIMMGGGMMGGSMMQPKAGTSGLADAMQAFMQSGQNHSGLTVQGMQALMDKLRSSNGTIQ